MENAIELQIIVIGLIMDSKFCGSAQIAKENTRGSNVMKAKKKQGKLSDFEKLALLRNMFGRNIIVSFFVSADGVDMINARVARSQDLFDDGDGDVPKRPLIPNDEELMDYFG